MRCSACVVVLFVATLCPPSVLARNWTDSAGKYSVEARFLDCRSGKVRLQKKDGQVILVAIEKLSKEDREFVEFRRSAKSRRKGALDEVDRELIAFSAILKEAVAMKKPLTRTDIETFLKAGPDLRAEVDTDVILKEPTLNTIVRAAEGNPALTAFAAKHGTTIKDLVRTALIATIAAQIIEEGGVEAIEKQFRKLQDLARSLAGPEDPSLGGAGLAPVDPLLLTLAKQIPQATYEAVRPYVKQILELGESKRTAEQGTDSDQKRTRQQPLPEDAAEDQHGRMRTWTDSTGKYSVEAKFVALKDGKVRLQKRDGKTISVPVDKLSERDQKQVKQLAASPTSASSSGMKFLAYVDYDPLTMMQALSTLKVFYGVMKEAKGVGEKADVRISDRLVVRDVPVEFVRACASISKGYNRGFYGGENSQDKPPGYWCVVAWVHDGCKVLGSKRECIQADAVGEAINPSVADLLGVYPRTAWLFCRAFDAKRDTLSLRKVLKRFDPDAPMTNVTKRTASAVAEEVIWTKELGIGNGTYASLPKTRRILQSWILECIGFEIGNPADSDPSKRQAALKRLDETKRVFINTWQEAYEKKKAEEGAE